MPNWLQELEEENGGNGQEKLGAMFDGDFADPESIAEKAPKYDVHFGTDEDGKPIYLPARAHWDTSGGSGSGKSVFIASIVRELIESESLP